MEIVLFDTLHKIPQTGAFGNGKGFSSNDSLVIAEGFFFIFVKNGTAFLSDTHRCYRIKKETLIILTPSLKATIHEMDNDFEFTCVYITPEYFDRKPAGQPLYNQLAEFIRRDRLPALPLKPDKSRYLQQTFALFDHELREFKLYTNGIIHHLCSLLMLQTADIFVEYNRYTPVYVKRSGEIYRKFRKLLVENYRQHHDIAFYADELNISTTYLSRIVKHTTGNTVRFHISELLSADARRLLEWPTSIHTDRRHTPWFLTPASLNRRNKTPHRRMKNRSPTADATGHTPSATTQTDCRAEPGIGIPFPP